MKKRSKRGKLVFFDQTAGAVDEGPPTPPFVVSTAGVALTERAAMYLLRPLRLWMAGHAHGEPPPIPTAYPERQQPSERSNARTLSTTRLSNRDFEALRAGNWPLPFERPTNYARDCLDGFNHARPCPYVSCEHHLFLHFVTSATDEKGERSLGRLREVDVEDFHTLPATCVLDVVRKNAGGMTLEAVGEVFGMERERIRQLEEICLDAIKLVTPASSLLGLHAALEDIAQRDDGGWRFRYATASSKNESRRAARRNRRRGLVVR